MIEERTAALLQDDLLRTRKALQRIRALVLSEAAHCPQYGSLTSESEFEIGRLCDLALGDGATDAKVLPRSGCKSEP